MNLTGFSLVHTVNPLDLRLLGSSVWSQPFVLWPSLRFLTLLFGKVCLSPPFLLACFFLCLFLLFLVFFYLVVSAFVGFSQRSWAGEIVFCKC